ncbi:facilitated trehalose transporter Tret1-like [Argiope bruennichi]|uniref:facilitated trehalose transporter Tret1-like n=1 Tax=Argiope bruennichi TaxID=94029 RepID=UPI0024947368|nr:facilitated trehalose transporter Tret1-like [Argiope bruennichi]
MPSLSEKLKNAVTNENMDELPLIPFVNLRNTHIAAISALLYIVVMGMVNSYSSAATVDMKLPGSRFQDITPDEITWIASLPQISGLVGNFFSGYITHKIGRKATLVFASSSYISSWLAIAYAPTIPVIYIGRLTCGLSAGICCVAVPAYIVEIAPTEIRGFLTSGFQLAYSIGVFLIISVGTTMRWSWLAIVGACLTTIALCLIVIMPESPTWLMRESRTHEALKGIAFLKGKNADLKKELQDISDNLNESKNNNFSLRELLHPTFYKPALIAVCLVFFQQASGINVVMSYTIEIFTNIGSAVTPNTSSTIVAAVQVIGTLLGSILMDKSGRKRLYIISGTCMTISLFILATYIYVFKFSGILMNLHVYGWIPLLSLIIFVLSFSLGVGPIPFVMAPEMSPIRFRSTIIAMAALLCSLFAFIATKLFEDMRTFFGLYGLFWTYSFFSFLSALFGYFILPETKGLTLRQISLTFSESVDNI